MKMFNNIYSPPKGGENFCLDYKLEYYLYSFKHLTDGEL